jgi:hypothetical protein
VRFAALLVLAACASSSDNARSGENVGSICVTTGEAGAPLAVEYRGPCLSGSCTEYRVASCDVVQLDRTTIRVASHAEWIDHTEEYGVCTRECAAISATCSTPEGVAAGMYTLVFGDSTKPLSISQTEPTCMERY